MRHGQTGSNLSGALDTAAPGADLTELGLRQAAAAVPHLVERGVTAAYSSHLVRAHQTALALADHLGIEPGVHEGLAEISAGQFEMLRDPASVTAYVETMMAWVAGDLDRRMPGSEDGHEFLARYDSAISAVVEQAQRAGHQSILTVSHGAAMGTWVRSRSTNLADFNDIGRFRNTGMVVLDGEPGHFAIREWLPDPVAGVEFDEPDALS